MPDVSRVEYDAALKRVRARANVRGLRLHDVTVADFTLAALGLDEPPTEACSCPSDADDPNAATERCLKSERACGHHCAHSWSHDRCCWCGMEWGESGEVVPPSETPKACPTCGGQVDKRFINCAACNGSGIDGGTT